MWDQKEKEDSKSSGRNFRDHLVWSVTADASKQTQIQKPEQQRVNSDSKGPRQQQRRRLTGATSTSTTRSCPVLPCLALLAPAMGATATWSS